MYPKARASKNKSNPWATQTPEVPLLCRHNLAKLSRPCGTDSFCLEEPSTSCHAQVHSKAVCSLCPNQLQHPRLSAAPTRPGETVSLSICLQRDGHRGSCTGSDPRSVWTVSRHENSQQQVSWEKHKVNPDASQMYCPRPQLSAARKSLNLRGYIFVVE